MNACQERQALGLLRTEGGHWLCTYEDPASRWHCPSHGYEYDRPKNYTGLVGVMSRLEKRDPEAAACAICYTTVTGRRGIANTERIAMDMTCKGSADHYSVRSEVTPPGTKVKLYFNIFKDIARVDAGTANLLYTCKTIHDSVHEALRRLNIIVPDAQKQPLVSFAETQTDVCSVTLCVQLVYKDVILANPIDLARFAGRGGHVHEAFQEANGNVQPPWDLDCYGEWKNVCSYKTGSHRLMISSEIPVLKPSDRQLVLIASPDKQQFMDRFVGYCPTKVPHTLITTTAVQTPLKMDSQKVFRNGLSDEEAEDIDEFWIPVLKGKCREIYASRFNAQSDYFARLSSQRERKHDVLDVDEVCTRVAAALKKRRLDTSSITVTRFGNVPGRYKLVIPGDRYCEIKDCIHEGGVYYIFDTSNMTYYQSDDKCLAHQAGGETPIVRCANPFDSFKTTHGKCGTRKIKTLLELYKSGSLARQRSSMAKLIAHAWHDGLKCNAVVKGKASGAFFNEDSGMWESSVELFLDEHLVKFVREFERVISLANGKYEPTPQIQAAMENAYENFNTAKLLSAISTANIDEDAIAEIDKRAEYVLPLEGGVQLDSVLGVVTRNKKERMFSRTTRIPDILPASDPRSKEMLQALIDIWIDPASKTKEQDIRHMRLLFGYWASGYVSDRKFYNIVGEGLNGKGFLEWLFKDCLGSFYANAPTSFLSARGTARQSAEAAAPAMMAASRARMLAISECEEDAKMNYSKLKGLTSGDIQSARELHGRLQQLIMQCKVVIFGNEPIDIGHQAAMEARFVLKELKTQFVDEPTPGNIYEKKRDLKLIKRLKSHARQSFGGILYRAQLELMNGKYDEPVLPPLPPDMEASTSAHVLKMNSMKQWKEANTEKIDENDDTDGISLMCAHASFTLFSIRRQNSADSKLSYEKFRRMFVQMFKLKTEETIATDDSAGFTGTWARGLRLKCMQHKLSDAGYIPIDLTRQSEMIYVIDDQYPAAQHKVPEDDNKSISSTTVHIKKKKRSHQTAAELRADEWLKKQRRTK